MEQQRAALEEQVDVSRAEVMRLETAYASAQDEIATLQDQVGGADLSRDFHVIIM